MSYIILHMWYFDSLVSFMYFPYVIFFQVLYSSHLNYAWPIENNKYFLTDRITRLIKFWTLIITMPHIYITLCHIQSIYTYILIFITTTWVKWGRYYILHFANEETKSEEMKWFVQGRIAIVGWIMIPKTILNSVLSFPFPIKPAQRSFIFSHLLFQQSLIEDWSRDS